MTTIANLLKPAALLPAAQQLADYRQFAECEVPDASGASKAYTGFIRPFSDDATARRVLRAIDAGLPIRVSGGRLHVDTANNLSHHTFEHFLVRMAVPCTVLILDFVGGEHPRALLVDPPMVPRFTQCSHVRPDKSVRINGHAVPALCVYSGNLFKFDQSRSRLEQFLDQTATYLAKHLIWLRTRFLFRRSENGTEVIHRPTPGERVTTLEVIRSTNFFWEGYWPGSTAPAGAIQHLATVKSTHECWCWSGKRYGACCRSDDLWRAALIERKQRTSELIWRLSHPGRQLLGKPRDIRVYS